MSVELGHFVLCSATALAAWQILLCIMGLRCAGRNWLPPIRLSSYMIVALLVFAFATLLYAFYISDFSVLMVAESSSRLKPLIFRLASLWANYAGSIFLWALFFSLYNLLFVAMERALKKDLKLWVCLINSLILCLFLLFLVLFANPFIRLYPPALQGTDLNALLEDVNLIIHPPLLYLGYSGLAVSFALSLTTLLMQVSDLTIAYYIKKYIKIAWIFLSLAMITGSYWAYYELGWGGYWSFDPVENYALMPWLAALGAMHSLPQNNSGRSNGLGVFFAILAFCLALIGTFFARTSFLFSVHSFMSDTTHSMAILLLIATIIVPAFTIFGFKLDTLPKAYFGLAWVMSICLLAAIAALFFSTLMPLLYNIVFHTNVFIKTTYYYYSFLPIMVFLLCIMPLGALRKYFNIHVVYYLIAGLSLCCLLYYLFYHPALFFILRPILFCFTLLVLFVELYNLYYRVKILGFCVSELASLLGHFGAVVLLFGLFMFTMFSNSSNLHLALGEQRLFKAADGIFAISYNKRFITNKPNYEAINYSFSIKQMGREHSFHLAQMQQRRYFRQKQQLGVIALVNYGFSQLYIAPREEEAGVLYITVMYNYDILLLWLGAIIIVCGAVVSLFNKREFITKVS